MHYPFFDPTFLLLIPGLLLALWAQFKVKGAYSRWSQKRNTSGLTGAELAKKILMSHNLTQVAVNQISGELTDNYDPIKKTLNLSTEVFQSDSIAALGVAAHETGHAIQHGTGYAALSFRNGLFPVANIGSMLAFPLFFLGLIMGYNKFLMDLGIWLFTAALAFTVITLPVEFNASSRAMAILSNSGYLNSNELAGVKEVLSAAALTYVAAALVALLNLVRLLILSRGRD